MYRNDNNHSGARHLRAACCCVLTISLMAGTPALAANAPEAIVADSPSDTIAPTLLSQARQHVKDTRLQTSSPDGAAAKQATLRSTESQKKRALILGLAGAGTAVAGIFVWRGDSGPNLPGITSGRKLTGQMMVGGGSALAVLGLMAAFK